MFTRRRGTNVGNVIAMIIGFIAVAIISGLPNSIARIIGGQNYAFYKQPVSLPIAEFPWWICFGTIVTFLVAICFRSEHAHERPVGVTPQTAP
ncbi:MAG TPA: hypothetical protein VGQ82_10710, partial [Chthoniobacterales bacterium]|nr:hypothetical protein [Chthoniobacterales bacterium]